MRDFCILQRNKRKVRESEINRCKKKAVRSKLNAQPHMVSCRFAKIRGKCGTYATSNSLVGVGEHARTVGIAHDDLVHHVQEQAMLHHANGVDEIVGQSLRVFDAFEV